MKTKQGFNNEEQGSYEMVDLTSENFEVLTEKEFHAQFIGLQSQLTAFAMKLTRNKSRADDLFQETAYKAYKNADRFRKGTYFKSWVTTIMYNTFINGYRKRKTRSNVEAHVEDLSYQLESKTITDSVYGNIMLKEVKQMIESLTDTYQVPMNMFLTGYRYKEIAKTLEIPMGTVKSRINYARKILQSKVIELYGEASRSAA